MPGGWNTGPSDANQSTQGANAASSLGATLTIPATANIKGSWVQLVASTPNDATALEVNTLYDGGNSSTATIEASVDIAVAPSGSESSGIILTDFEADSSYGGSSAISSIRIPVSIPAGSRIAGRCQGNAANGGTVYVTCELLDSSYGSPSGSPIDTIGFLESATLGTAVDPGTVTNTKGLWTQLSSAIPHDWRGFYAAVDNQRNANQGNQPGWLIDLGIGASGSEQVVVSNAVWTPRYTGSGRLILGPYMLPILSGTRFAARAQSSLTSSLRIIGVTIYGIRA